MGYVKNILHVKGDEIFSISPETIVYNALELLYEKNISALLVMENGTLAGIFTERDYARKVVLKGKASKETLIREIMTSNLITVTSDYSIEESMRLMTNNFIRHLPVVDDGKLTGIVSIGDVVKFLIEEQKYIISHMENYIKGS